MIPGFEDQLVDKKPSKFTIDCKFPEDYFKKDLANVDAKFEINLKKVQEIIKAKLIKICLINCKWISRKNQSLEMKLLKGWKMKLKFKKKI